VHGAFEDGSIWDSVVERLAANPLRCVGADSASLAALLGLTAIGHGVGDRMDGRRTPPVMECMRDRPVSS
jgi:hypothetical protein